MKWLRWLRDFIWVRDLPDDIKVPPDDGQRGPIAPLDGCPDMAAVRHRDNLRLEAFVRRIEADADTDD